MLACHAGGPGSIPGRCSFILVRKPYVSVHFEKLIHSYELETLTKPTKRNAVYFKSLNWISFKKITLDHAITQRQIAKQSPPSTHLFNFLLKKLIHSCCRNPGSNQGPLDLQSNALPTELFRLRNLRMFFKVEIE